MRARAPGEIQRLYIDGAWQGRGAANLLMTAGIEKLKRRRADVVWLGVWERNPRAIAFYRKCAFTEVGDHTFQFVTDRQRDMPLARAV